MILLPIHNFLVKILFMKILLVAVNASYMHTNIAVRSLKYYVEQQLAKNCSCNDILIDFIEFTINQPVGELLRGIAFSQADIVLFSTYIWNAQIISQILPDIKKVLPECILGAGGPEFGYGASKYMESHPELDFIIHGEGEQTLCSLIKSFYHGKLSEGFVSSAVSEIPGLFLRNSENRIIFTGEPPLLHDLDLLPFNYPELLSANFDPDNKIYYYESSRGCPYACSYCLSSVDKRVRFKNLEQTCKELQIFLDANVKLVKFVDRTYNLMPERYIKIWEYILQHHNHKTMFHFEIEAEYLTKESIEFLQKVPAGIMQFEIGVQTANKKTLKSINRSQNIEKLSENIRLLPRTIHQHLDLIAGLPYEDLTSFGNSYDFVMSLKPDALQLGFLKVLPGTQMEAYAKKEGWKWQEQPVYETFSTPYLSFSDIAFLKNIEILTDAYWNKETFRRTMNYIFRTVSPWAFISALASFAETNGSFDQARKESYWFSLIFDFFNCSNAILKNLNLHLLKDLLRYDFVRSGKKGNFPAWYIHNYDKEKHRTALENQGLLHNCRIAFSYTEYEEFDFDVTADKPEEIQKTTALLIRYD